MEVSKLKIKADDDLAIELRDIIIDAVKSKGFELRDCFTGPRGTGLHQRKVEMNIVKRAPTFGKFIYGVKVKPFGGPLPPLATTDNHNGRCDCAKTEQPAETKDQVAQDAKIKIENLLRRLRVLNVDENFINPKAEPTSEIERVAISLQKAFGKSKPSFNTLHQHLSAALREAERLAPVSKLTDDDSGEVD